jgi:hypothetical protein
MKNNNKKNKNFVDVAQGVVKHGKNGVSMCVVLILYAF